MGLRAAGEGRVFMRKKGGKRETERKANRVRGGKGDRNVLGIIREGDELCLGWASNPRSNKILIPFHILLYNVYK